MLPTLLEIGPITLHAYGLMIALGFLAALHFIRRDVERAGIDPQRISDLAFWSLIVGVIATRVLHIIMFPEDYSWSDPFGWIAIWRGGLVFQGAVPAVMILCWIVLRRWKIPFWKTADAVMPWVPLGHAIGRIGCFFNGCCYGRRTDAFVGIPFRRVPWDLAESPTGSPVYLDHCQRFSELSYRVDRWSYPVHPTQLYTVAGLVCVGLVLLALRKKWHPFEGFTLPLYLSFYGLVRFIVEFFRGDGNPRHFGGLLSDQQVFSLLFASLGVILFAIIGTLDRRRRQRVAAS